MKKIIILIKKFIINIFLLYGYNLVSQRLGLIIPINIFTVLFLTIFGVPGLFSLIFILIYSF